MNLTKLLIDKNKQIEDDTRKKVSMFLNEEMDIDQLKKDIIEYFKEYISSLTINCSNITANFALQLKKDKNADQYISSKLFNDIIASNIESILNLSCMGAFNVIELNVQKYDPFYKDIEIILKIQLLDKDF